MSHYWQGFFCKFNKTTILDEISYINNMENTNIDNLKISLHDEKNKHNTMEWSNITNHKGYITLSCSIEPFFLIEAESILRVDFLEVNGVADISHFCFNGHFSN